MKSRHFDRDPAFAGATHFLVGPEAEVRRLADTVGLPTATIPPSSSSPIPAGVTLVSADGRISRYVLGIGDDPLNLRLELMKRRAATIAPCWTSCCCCCTPMIRLREIQLVIGNVVRAGGIATVIALGLLLFFAARKPQRLPGRRMNQGIHFLPETASAHAGEMNWLFAGLLITSGMILALVFGRWWCSAYATGATVRSSAATGWARRGGWRSLDNGNLRAVSRPLLLGRQPLHPPVPASDGHDRHLCRRQAVDVEGRASRRTARDQRDAHPGRSPDPAGHDLPGRDPRLRHSRLPHPPRRPARTL